MMAPGEKVCQPLTMFYRALISGMLAFVLCAFSGAGDAAHALLKLDKKRALHLELFVDDAQSAHILVDHPAFVIVLREDGTVAALAPYHIPKELPRTWRIDDGRLVIGELRFRFKNTHGGILESEPDGRWIVGIKDQYRLYTGANRQDRN